MRLEAVDKRPGARAAEKYAEVSKNMTDCACGRTVQPRPALEDITQNRQEHTDAELVALVKKKIPWAFEPLVQRHYANAQALATQMCDGNVHEAEDMTQQAFLNALGKIDTFKGNASFKTWLYRILINTCLDSRRRRKRLLGIFSFPLTRRGDGESVTVTPDDFPDETAGNNPETAWRDQELRRDIQKALGELPEKQRLVFQLKVLQELSIPEVADILEMAPGTVKSHLFRATRYMRKAMAGWAGR